MIIGSGLIFPDIFRAVGTKSLIALTKFNSFVKKL